jgi:hypothetical protein
MKNLNRPLVKQVSRIYDALNRLKEVTVAAP